MKLEAPLLLMSLLFFLVAAKPVRAEAPTQAQNPETLRVATWNVSLFRNAPGGLRKELEQGDSQQIWRIAEVLRRIRPEIVLLNEFDDDPTGRSGAVFAERYLNGERPGMPPPILFPHRFRAPVNTGEPSGMDLNGDGDTTDPEDAYGFGRFPGQYGMLVLSRHAIDHDKVRTFQRFLWSRLPSPRAPRRNDGSPFYPDAVWKRLRLSSKSLWDVPIRVGEETLHLIASHPTPPVFDGPEDRNGKRNHDEIRLVADYVTPGWNGYLVDDRGSAGGLAPRAHFVIAGDLNADPADGDSSGSPIRRLLAAPRVQGTVMPISEGAVEAARRAGGANASHKGPAAADTAAFPPRVGNLRIDYVLPSKSLRVVDSGVFWPRPDDAHAALLQASDHRLVWIDLQLPLKQSDGG